MKRVTRQLCAWWPSNETQATLLSRIDKILLDTGFTIPDPTADRHKNNRIFGWTRVTRPKRKVWFALCPGRPGPWLVLKMRTGLKADLALFANLFDTVLDDLKPHECVLCDSNMYQMAVFAEDWCLGGLTTNVNLDADPALVTHPGDPTWFDDVGHERRFVSHSLLQHRNTDAIEFARRTGRHYHEEPAGFLFTSSPSDNL